MKWWYLYAILAVVVAAIVVLYFYLKRRFGNKAEEQQKMVNQHKIAATILVLEKKKEKVTKANLPKSVIDQIPMIYKVRKVPLVKAKVGPQVLDLLCDEDVFDKLPERKSVKVDLAGIFIAGIRQGKK